MTDYKTMRVPEDAHEKAKAHKEQLGVTWGEYLTLPTEDGSTETQTHDTDTSELMNQLTRLNNRLDELPEQTAGKVQERLR